MVSVEVVSSVQTYKYENECCQKLEYTGVPVAVHRFTDHLSFSRIKAQPIITGMQVSENEFELQR